MLQLIRIRFTTLSNKVVSNRRIKFVNKPFITNLSVRPYINLEVPAIVPDWRQKHTAYKNEDYRKRTTQN